MAKRVFVTHTKLRDNFIDFNDLELKEDDNNTVPKIFLIDTYIKSLNELKDLIRKLFNLNLKIDKLFLKNNIEIENLLEINNDDYLVAVSCIENKTELKNEMTPDVCRDKEEWIRLNVGGKIFFTTRTTLTSRDLDSFFGRMFSSDNCNNWTHKLCDNNAILIDRSSRYFEVILDYMRNGKLIVDTNVSLEGVLEEARFFSIDGLIYLIEKEMSDQNLKSLEKENTLLNTLTKALLSHEDSINVNFKLDRRHVIQSLMQTKSDAFLRFQSINLQGCDLSKLDLSWINFKFANLSNTNLSGSNLSFSCLERTDLSNSNLEYTKCHGVRMTCANLENANLCSADFEDPGGKVANLEGANLKNVNARMCNMNTVNLRVAKLKNADFTGSSLKFAKLAGADLENCIMNGCDLTEANLRGANFIGTHFNDVQNPLHMSQIEILR